MKNLKNAFLARKTWHNNRSSTVFPCFNSNATVHYLVFQDYWSWKSKIQSDQIRVIIRLYSSEGVALETKEFDIDSHNCINLNEEFSVSFDNSQDPPNLSSFEVEIISLLNLGFPFPGIMLFCEDKKSGEVTCVHSGGRRLNSNEARYLKQFTETNWLSIQNQCFTPFFHIFNDSVQFLSDNERVAEVSVNLNCGKHSAFNATVDLGDAPFWSKIFYIKDIFPQRVLDQINDREIWIEVQFKSTAFPRMIVGNYDLLQDFHYITHSFGKVESRDYIQTSVPGEVTSFLPLLNAMPLNLKAKSYPTNAPSTVKSIIYEYPPASEENQKLSESHVFESRGDVINSFENNSTSMKLYNIVGKCPARLNVSYNYSLKNSRHPTDIATGFKSKDYPPKESHWGHGVCKKDFRTLIFVRNISHSNEESKPALPINIDIELFDRVLSKSISLHIPSSGWNFIEINPEVDFVSDQEFFSWRFKDKMSTRMETFWVSYNIHTGAICGEHGF